MCCYMEYCTDDCMTDGRIFCLYTVGFTGVMIVTQYHLAIQHIYIYSLFLFKVKSTLGIFVLAPAPAPAPVIA